jgi:hypothetical protein
MDIVDLIIGLAVIGWVVVPIIKKIFGGSNPSAKKSGIANKLSDFIKDIQKEMELAAGNTGGAQAGSGSAPAARAENEKAPNPWDVFLDTRKSSGADVPVAEPDLTPPPLPPREARFDFQNSFKETIVPEREPVTKPDVQQDKAPLPQCEDSGKKICHRANKHRRKLRNAVMWAEILAPPVSLRDNKKI